MISNDIGGSFNMLIEKTASFYKLCSILTPMEKLAYDLGVNQDPKAVDSANTSNNSVKSAGTNLANQANIPMNKADIIPMVSPLDKVTPTVENATPGASK